MKPEIMTIIVTVFVVATIVLGVLLKLMGEKSGELGRVIVYLVGNKFITLGCIVWASYIFVTGYTMWVGAVVLMVAINGIFMDCFNWPRVKEIIKDNMSNTNSENE